MVIAAVVVTALPGCTAAVPARTVVAGRRHQAYLLRQWGSGGHDTFTSEELFTIGGTGVYMIAQTVFELPLATGMSLPALTAKLIASVRARP